MTEKVRDLILSGQFPAGMHVQELPLAAMVGVSRTPVRAALAMLAKDGLLNYSPKRGYFVRGFQLADLLAAYEARSVLEATACRLAVERGIEPAVLQRLEGLLEIGDAILAKGTLEPADLEPYRQMNVEFHETILDSCGNHFVATFVRQTYNLPLASDRVMLWEHYEVIRRSHDDHHRIVQAFVERNGPRAEALMREHIHFAGTYVRKGFGLNGRPMPNALEAIGGGESITAAR